MLEKKYGVQVIRDTQTNNISTYRNVHNVEVLPSGSLSIQVEKKSTVFMNPRTWETCRIDEM
jgi:hypothetical protein